MGKSQSEPQEKELQKQTDAVLRLLTKRGVLPNEKITDEKRRAALQKRQKESYHNTELLLKNYRIVAWMVECFPETVAAELEKPFETVDALLDGMEISSTFGERKLERRTAAVEETRLMLDRVNDALTVLRKKPENGQLLYDLIYLSYIAPEVLPIQELLYRLCVSTRHYYRLRKEAILVLSLRLWSSPDPTMDLWLDLLTL